VAETGAAEGGVIVEAGGGSKNKTAATDGGKIKEPALGTGFSIQTAMPN
jgi:hypothetical protein